MVKEFIKGKIYILTGLEGENSELATKEYKFRGNNQSSCAMLEFIDLSKSSRIWDGSFPFLNYSFEDQVSLSKDEQGKTWMAYEII